MAAPVSVPLTVGGGALVGHGVLVAKTSAGDLVEQIQFFAAQVNGPNNNVGSPFNDLPTRGSFKRSEINIQGLEDTANTDIGNGLTEAGRALTKHASGQRGTSPFPPLSGNNRQISQTASQQLNEILNSPDASFTRLARGGIQVKLPDGRGVRFNADGSLSGFID